ncbi:MAG: OmpA family protein [Firmicutes bacterium]|nr:OmpA family protein [Bacillota bacterium]
MRRKSKKDVGPPPPAQWLTTYGDMVTLLLTFFVVLFSMSSVDAKKFQAMLEGLHLSFGVITGGNTIQDGLGINGATILPESGTRITAVAQIQELYDEISAFLEEEGLEGAAVAVLEERGVIIRFKDKILFDTGEAVLRPDGKAIIDKLSPLIEKIPNQVRVEGHADNRPINTSRYPSNWELSTARATSVIRYLLANTDIEPDRLSAAGYGEYRPLVPNDTPEHRAQNRRVDIVLLRLDYGFSEPSSRLGGLQDGR